MLAIHNSNSGFHSRWITYCKEHNISYKLVNCYANDIVKQLKDCHALMWHHAHQNSKDLIIAKQILFALEHTGFQVFPDFRTSWHFDDKLGQKYLFDCIGAPTVPTYLFFNRKEALHWVKETQFPKIFKLRGGAGSVNVKLIKDKKEAIGLINQAFGKGFSNYDKWGSLKERWRKYRSGKAGIWEPVKGVLRLVSDPPFVKVLGRESDYVYFQDFIEKNDSDTRVIVIDDKAFAIKRYVRKKDFRASGSGDFSYAKEVFDERCVRLAFHLTSQLKSQCAAYDFVFDQNNQPLVVEVSYGFVKEVYDSCPGYWDRQMNWHEGKFNAQGWMVELILNQLDDKEKK